MAKPWYPYPDDTRESWCFLVLQSRVQEDNPYIEGWQLGLANANRLVRTETMGVETNVDEDTALNALWEELDSLRYEKTTLITPSHNTVVLLRTRLLASDKIESPSLRGFWHVNLKRLLREQFIDVNEFFSPIRPLLAHPYEQSEPGVGKEGKLVKEMWKVRKQIGPLIPVKELRGKPL